MSYQPFRVDLDARSSFAVGFGTFLLGFLLIVLVELFGLHPDTGIWRAMDHPDTGMTEYMGLYGLVHLPILTATDGRVLHSELLLYAVVQLYIVVMAGLFLVRRRQGSTDGAGAGSHNSGAMAGASIVVGYFPGALLFGGFVAARIDVISTSELFLPIVVIGICYPVACGAIGGAIARIL